MLAALIISALVNVALFLMLARKNKRESDYEAKIIRQRNDVKILQEQCNAYRDYIEHKGGLK